MIVRSWKKELFTIPNLLSYLRIALIPVYMVIYLNATKCTDYYVAAAILTVSCLTDLIDGKIARKFNMITTVGKFLDPLADKLTQFALILCLAMRYPILWYLIGVFVVKEIFQAIALAVAYKRGKMLDGAFISGKLCTTALFFSLTLMVLIPNLSNTIVNIIFVVDMIFTVYAFIDYFLAYCGKHKRIYDFEIETE